MNIDSDQIESRESAGCIQGGWSSCPLLASCLVVLTFLLARIFSYVHYLNKDVALFLQCGKLILQGKLPYIDFVELNPPLIFYISTIPIWLNEKLNISLPLLVNMITWILLVYSISACIMMLRKKADIWDDFAPVILGFLLFNGALFYHWGQREHLFILLFMPFFVMRYLRQDNRVFAGLLPAAVGLLAGVGISIKPHFALLPLSLEAYWFFSQGTSRNSCIFRLKDPEVLAGMLPILLYIVSFAIFAPLPVKQAYFDRWLPLVITGSGALNCSWELLLGFGENDGCMLANLWSLPCVLTGAFVLRKHSSLVMPLVIWMVCGWLIYLVQQRGWPYHMIIMLSGFFMLANLEIALIAKLITSARVALFDWMKRLWRPREFSFMLYCFLLCLLAPFLIRDSYACGAFSFNPLNRALLKYCRKGDRVLILSYKMFPAFPALLQLDTPPASRYLWLFPIRMCEFLKEKSTNPNDQIHYNRLEECMIGEICEDIRRFKPRMIALCQPEPQFDAWTNFPFLRSGSIESVLGNYDPVAIWNSCFSIWLRRDLPARIEQQEPANYLRTQIK